MNLVQPIICLSSSHIPFLLYALVIFLTSTIISPSYGGGNETDREALLKFKSMITLDPYGALTSWNNSLQFCNWSGVTCGKRHRRVTSLVLESQGLEGSLSSHIGNLSFLRFLSLSNNSFLGNIPHELGHLSRLRFLHLYENKFNGVIPANISGCTNLQVLGLRNNKLVGSIPKEISYLSKLDTLSLYNNNLTGGIPTFLGNLTSMEVFSVAKNPFGGSIPDTLGHWKNIKVFYCGSCNLSGTIPYSLYNLSLVINISLADNQLTGSLHPAIGAMFTHLVGLQLWGNQLIGPLPPSISNCSRLRHLEITRNKFSGKLTINFSKLKDISHISLGENLFGSKEDDEMKFIDSLKNCTRLEKLIMHNCKFQGPLPISIGNLSNQLNSLYLEENELHGVIPKSIGNLVGLEVLSLGGNQFTGNIPSTIGNLQKLEAIYLYENQLSGQIPDAIGNLQKLKEIYLYQNHLSGQIPDAIGNLSLLTMLSLSLNMLEGDIPLSLGNCHNLLALYLHNNKLSGNIPTKILELSSLSIAMDLSQNNLSGSLSTNVENLKMLSELDLSDNNLSSDIPSSLGGCASLETLSLKGNLFQGMIPSSLSSLKGLVRLDISHNNISGQIPHFFEQFSLQYLNLSFNDFEGEVPMQGVFSNTSAFFVSGNNKLCGGFAELGLPKCKLTKKHTKKFPFFVILILIVSTLFTLTCLTCAWCKKKRSQPSQTSTSERIIKVSYSQLLKATDGFSKANLIGNGGSSSVYKGILDENGDRFVAIKVLHLQNPGAQRSFMRECEVWQNIRHRNLLKIITSCSSVDFQGNDFKALVYEFMSNGSLHDWLHSSESTSRLNLLQRITILTDVAHALDYIHNHCVPSIIHGDLKPSNILLDDDMVAHIGDFGLARFLETTSYQNSSIGIRGTIGYVAPEYGLGSEMTTSGDVYSFGILLLEVVTGKRPTENIFNEGLNLHKYASMTLLDHVSDVIGVNIVKFYQDGESVMQNKEASAKKIEACLASTIKIGVSCSMDFPRERVDIKKVVHELQYILATLQNI